MGGYKARGGVGFQPPLASFLGGENLQGGSEKRNGRRILYTTPNIQNHVNALYFNPLPLYLPISLSTKISKTAEDPTQFLICSWFKQSNEHIEQWDPVL